MITKTKTAYMSAAEIAQKYGLTYQAVNHYTNLGLLEVAVKNGNVRMYIRSKVKDRLSKVSKLANEGYSLRLIRKKLIGV
ncbi:MAG TPA: MerR family transcriptional regulator [Candidatus Omnitrophota bacterium]|nr:MerR family transcriptional regulator [Candidatus Omnitrophota bacterium]